jgi:hypothetical protein
MSGGENPKRFVFQRGGLKCPNDILLALSFEKEIFTSKSGDKPYVLGRPGIRILASRPAVNALYIELS